MGINVNAGSIQVNNELVSGAKPGIYQSKRGSVLLYPDSNAKGNGKLPADCVVVLKDVDSDFTYVKSIDKVKGQYTYLCGLDDVNMQLPGQAPSPCCMSSDF